MERSKRDLRRQVTTWIAHANLPEEQSSKWVGCDPAGLWNAGYRSPARGHRTAGGTTGCYLRGRRFVRALPGRGLAAAVAVRRLAAAPSGTATGPP